MRLMFPMTRRKTLVAFAVIGLSGAIAAWIRLGPLPPGLLEAATTRSTSVSDRRGTPIYEARDADGTHGTMLDATCLPSRLVDATVAAEDRRFFAHGGLDPAAILRAAWRNVVAGRVVQGASTITQQVAKLLIARHEGSAIERSRRGIAAKARETIVALRLEHRLDKAQILALYLSLAPYGNQIVGVERASAVYFGRPADQLTVAQAAFLAGLPQRPSGFNPYRARDAAIARQRTVLARMRARGLISGDEAAEALSERLVFERSGKPLVAPHFVELALAAAGAQRPSHLRTTIDLALQRELEGIVRSHRRSLQEHGAHNVAVVVMENSTGAWRAWEGSGDYFDSDHGGAINGAVAPRQPGSALKPFTYALAFDHGYTPASVLPDVSASFPTAEPGVVYSPRNYDNRFRGPLLARRALAGSINVPAVVLASNLGVADLLRLLHRAGLTTLDRTAAHYGLGITLGNAEVRLDELVAAYASFARNGSWLSPTMFEDEAIARRAGRGEPSRAVASPMAAYWVTEVLADSSAREFVFGRGGSLEFPFPVAVKTGTSQAYRDNWAIGYTRDVTVGVWVGNFDRASLRRSSGVTGAAPIFHDVLLAAERHLTGRAPDSIAAIAPPIVERPGHLERVAVCGLSGMRAGDACLSRTSEWLPADADAAACSWHHQTESGPVVIWPAEYREWAGSRTPQPLYHAARPAPSQGQTVKVVETKGLSIVSPAEGAVYLIDPTLPAQFQGLALRASPAPSATLVRWSVNDRVVGTAEAADPLMWPLSRGRHHIQARDEVGNVAETTITVR